MKTTEVATVKDGSGQETTLSLLIMKKRLKRKGNNYESLDAAKY